MKICKFLHIFFFNLSKTIFRLEKYFSKIIKTLWPRFTKLYRLVITAQFHFDICVVNRLYSGEHAEYVNKSFIPIFSTIYFNKSFVPIFSTIFKVKVLKTNKQVHAFLIYKGWFTTSVKCFMKSLRKFEDVILSKIMLYELEHRSYFNSLQNYSWSI